MIMHFENLYLEYAVRLSASFLCGLVLGLERKTKHHTVGIRTLVLISMSSTLLSIISYTMAELPGRPQGGDPTRIAAQIVSGIGFLGAGAIIRQGLNVRGLTSAAVIWTAAAIGLACGIGQYFISFITVILAMVCLGILEKLEYRLCPAEKSKKLIIVYENHSVDIELVQKEIIDAGLYKRDLNMSESVEKERIELIFSVKAPENFNMGHLTKRLMKLGKIIKISITDD